MHVTLLEPAGVRRPTASRREGFIRPEKERPGPRRDRVGYVSQYSQRAAVGASSRGRLERLLPGCRLAAPPTTSGSWWPKKSSAVSRYHQCPPTPSSGSPRRSLAVARPRGITVAVGHTGPSMLLRVSELGCGATGG